MQAHKNRSTPLAVLGAGSWGTTIAIHLYKKGYPIRLWEHFPENVALMNKTRRNPLLPGIPIPRELPISNSLDEVISGAEVIATVVPSHVLRAVLEKVAGKVDRKVLIVNLAKGMERDTLKRMSEVIQEVLGHPQDKIVTIYGPSHAEEVAREIPTLVVAASTDLRSAERVQNIFMTPYFRVYTNTDIIGVEVAGSIKNVIAIASGICDGLGLGDNSKAALITRGLLEITRMGMRLGGKEQTFAGLSGVGDLIVTCNSKHSRNRYVGEEIGKGRKLNEILDGMTMIAEGVHTCETVHQLMQRYQVVMPISNEIYRILFQNKDPQQGLRDLMTREPVKERHSLPKVK